MGYMTQAVEDTASSEYENRGAETVVSWTRPSRNKGFPRTNGRGWEGAELQGRDGAIVADACSIFVSSAYQGAVSALERLKKTCKTMAAGTVQVAFRYFQSRSEYQA